MIINTLVVVTTNQVTAYRKCAQSPQILRKSAEILTASTNMDHRKSGSSTFRGSHSINEHFVLPDGSLFATVHVAPEHSSYVKNVTFSLQRHESHTVVARQPLSRK